RPPVVVMEQFDTDQQETLDTILKTISYVPQEERQIVFKKALKWEQSPWDTYNYTKLFEALLLSHIAIRAGDPPLAFVRKVSRYGSAALTTQDLELLGLNENLEKGVFEDLKAEIKDSHCGMLPDGILGNFAFAQRYRDAILAKSTVQALRTYGGGIVLAGNAHVRRDRGIPWYLKKQLDSTKFLSILLLEVEEGKEQPEDYDLRTSQENPIADYIVFTPKAPREDPCLKFGKGGDSAK
ncbi:MAG: ChaN family lipoprotein, partial [Hyphomicrobium sp.]